MTELFDWMAFYNPSEEFLSDLRTINVVVGLVATLVLLFFLALPRWREWTVSIRLGWMSLFMLVLTGTYGTFEVQYMDTYFRVPMVTVSLIWAIVAALWPRDKGPNAPDRE